MSSLALRATKALASGSNLPYISIISFDPRITLYAIKVKSTLHFSGQVCLHLASQMFFIFTVNFAWCSLSDIAHPQQFREIIDFSQSTPSDILR